MSYQVRKVSQEDIQRYRDSQTDPRRRPPLRRQVLSRPSRRAATPQVKRPSLPPKVRKVRPSCEAQWSSDSSEDYVMLVQLYGEKPGSEKYEELRHVFRKNCGNALISKVVVFFEVIGDTAQKALDWYDGFSSEIDGKEKIDMVYTRKTQRRSFPFQELLDYANEHFEGRKIIISNNDIYFDATLKLLSGETLTKQREVVCLTRTNVFPVLGKNGKPWQKHPASQDSWIFVSPIDRIQANCKLGWCGSDLIMSSELYSNGYNLSNPTDFVNSFHYQRTDNTETNNQLYLHTYGEYLTVPFTSVHEISTPKLIRLNNGCKSIRPHDIAGLRRTLDLFWQYPACTEQEFYNQNKDTPGYWGIPWATIIDSQVNINGLVPVLRLLTKGPRQTCCQHIHFRRLLGLFKKLQVTVVYTPHKVKGQDYIDGIEIRPCAMYAVNFEDPKRNMRFLEVAPERDLLYAFVGAHQRSYLSDIRLRIFSMDKLENTVVVNTGDWHFNSIVYSDSQERGGETSDLTEQHLRKTRTYNDILMRSRFSLCPSGSGPNSIRLWESLAAGAIPVVLADTLELPAHPLWKDAVVFLPESYLGNLKTVLDELAPREDIMRQNCLRLYSHFKDDYSGCD